MHRIAIVLGLGIFVVLSSGCTPQVPKPPPKATVKGKVEMDGSPMKEGEIEFEATAQPSVFLDIKDGVFSGEVFATKNTVKIHKYKAGPPSSTDPEKKPTKVETLPAKYNSDTKFTADVPEGGKSDLEFKVTAN